MRLRLDPPIPLETPKGYGLAHFIDDYGIDHEDYWGVCLTETGEWWWFKNSEVRGCENKTVGRDKPLCVVDPKDAGFKYGSAIKWNHKKRAWEPFEK